MSNAIGQNNQSIKKGPRTTSDNQAARKEPQYTGKVALNARSTRRD